MRSVREDPLGADVPEEVLDMCDAPPDEPTRASWGEGLPDSTTVPAGSDSARPLEGKQRLQKSCEYN